MVGAAVDQPQAMLLARESFQNLCRALDILSDLAQHPSLIEDVAREVAISPLHFIRIFEAVFGPTPHQFRMRSRLDQAKPLLAAGGHSVTDVCMEVGCPAPAASAICSRAG